MLNGTDSDSDEEMFPSKFDKLLTFSLFFLFIKTRKQYIHNNKIPQNTLAEVSIIILPLKRPFEREHTSFLPTKKHLFSPNIHGWSCDKIPGLLCFTATHDGVEVSLRQALIHRGLRLRHWHYWKEHLFSYHTCNVERSNPFLLNAWQFFLHRLC